MVQQRYSNMKIIIVLTALAIAFCTAAKEATGDAAGSPVISYLLDKLEKLETKVAVKPTTRNTREAEDGSPCSKDAAGKCQSGVVTYVRWGNSTCPPEVDIIYSGVVAGSSYTQQGAAVDPLCLPPNPQYLISQGGYQNYVQLQGAEYEVSGITPLNQAQERNVPCALCQVYGRTNKIMIPSRYECPTGWTREYYGYLMAGNHGQHAATQFTCMDESLEQIQGSAANTNGYLFYTVEAQCGHFIPCSDKELTCAVCTK